MGTITWEGFIRGSKHILSVSEAINDGWRFHGNLEVCNGAYFGRKVIVAQRNGATTTSDPSATSCEDNIDGVEADPSCLDIDPVTLAALFGEFHVVYNEAYSVPTLFFRVWRADGSPVPIEDVWREFASRQALESDAIDALRTLTQQEHPFLGEPWYLVHPCRTSELMSAVSEGDDANLAHRLSVDELYMVRWLSTVAPLVGCPLSARYASGASDHARTGEKEGSGNRSPAK